MAALRKASFVLRRGGIVAFPTETVYGLGAHAFDPVAVKKIFEAKGRPADNPLIVHIAEIDAIENVASRISDEAKLLMKAFWPGPFTLVLPKHPRIPLEVTAGTDTVAVRLPAHPIARELLRVTGFPIAAPSANLAGKPSPTEAMHVAEDLSGRIDLLLDGGRAGIGLESTVVDASGDKIILLRQGAVTAEAMKKVLGYTPQLAKLKAGRPAMSPGLKYKHYAPKAELILFKIRPHEVMVKCILEEMMKLQKNGVRIGILCCNENKYVYRSANKVISCGSRRNIRNIASNLFACLRKFDHTDVDVILCEYFEEKGIGHAVADRLVRASSKVFSNSQIHSS